MLIHTTVPKRFWGIALLCAAGFLTGCANNAAKSYDYTAYKESRPRSILVLPPINNSTDVQASNSVLAQATQPLAESGYYVMPVSLVTETFKENGLEQPADAHQAPAEKLQKIFGADAALYITISRFGSSFQLINSVTVVSADARLVDLKSGAVLWSGSATANSDEGQSQQQGGLLAAVIGAVVKQVLASVNDQSHKVAGIATQRLLQAHPNGLLYGPRSPNYGKD